MGVSEAKSWYDRKAGEGQTQYISPSDAQASIDQIYADMQSGSSILHGVGTPADSVGVSGSYYVDVDGNTLYGPKTATAISPPAQTLFTNQYPSYEFDVGESVIGETIQFLRAGKISALRYYRASQTDTAVTSTTLHLYRSELEIATATTSNEIGSGWQTATLASPIDVVMGDTLRVMADFVTGQYVVSDHNLDSEYGEGGYYYYQLAPITNKFMRSAMSYFGYYDDGGLYLDPFPVPMFLDAVFTALPTMWPVAVSGTYLFVATPSNGGDDLGGDLYINGDFLQQKDGIDTGEPGATLRLENRSQNNSNGIDWSIEGIWENVDVPIESFQLQANVSSGGSYVSISSSKTINVESGEQITIRSFGLPEISQPGIVQISGPSDGQISIGLDSGASQVVLFPEGAGIIGDQLFLGSNTLPIQVGDAIGGPQLITNVANPIDPSDVTNKSYVDTHTPPILVLGSTDPIPGGTLAGTVIVRKAS